jgi:thymidylate synthase (FAD)
MAREMYTHIGGSPTRVQASTRYITYKDFGYVVPAGMTDEQHKVYTDTIKLIQDGYGKLKELNCQNDITGYILPLCMETEFIWKGNIRTLENMFNQRLCQRALQEYINFMRLLKQQISALDNEWRWIADNLFVPKCVKDGGICKESRGCGMFPKKGGQN